tara:strand:+ start:52 stop:333 length:282 start_codon:yes stop_codon:yes gene_type:complete
MINWILNFIRGGDDLEVAPENETPEDKTKREQKLEARRQRWEDRQKKLEAKRSYRLEKIDALKEKIYAVASKRKWLFLIIAAVIVGYLVFKFT